MAAITVTVAGTPAPGVIPALADTSRSGSAMRMRAESRGHGRPAGAVDTSDRTTEAFMKIMEEMRAELAATKREVVGLRGALATSEGRYTELAAASGARDAALTAVVARQAETITGLSAEVVELKAQAAAERAAREALAATVARLGSHQHHGWNGKTSGPVW